MPSQKFPGPTHNRIIEPNTDKQINTVPLEKMGFGARPVSQMKPDDNSGLKLKHVKNEA